MKQTNKSMRGVTLVEIAIVLVIIGLLLGGILKGQELINNAKVRSIADRQSSLKAAWFSFIDRYQALPGDYLRAQQNIPGAGAPVPAAASGAGTGDGIIIEGESSLVMQHLTGAGYLRCPQCTYNGNAVRLPDGNNSLQNQYGGVMAIFVDGLASANSRDSTYLTEGTRRPRLMVHTGNLIPSNIISEVDRKLDDGSPAIGDFRFSDYKAVGIAPAIAECVDSVGGNAQHDDGAHAPAANKVGDYDWRFATEPPEQNCGGVVSI